MYALCLNYVYIMYALCMYYLMLFLCMRTYALTIHLYASLHVYVLSNALCEYKHATPHDYTTQPEWS